MTRGGFLFLVGFVLGIVVGFKLIQRYTTPPTRPANAQHYKRGSAVLELDDNGDEPAAEIA